MINKNINLTDLLLEADDIVEVANDIPNLVVSSIEYDSRNVKKNSLFVAIDGYESDGHSFIDMAVEKGASVVVVQQERYDEFSYIEKNGIVILISNDSRKALSKLSTLYYGNGSKDIFVIGVTGTNGKTSITYMLESIFKQADKTPGVIGTINYRWKDKVIPAPNTTPESKDLQKMIAEMREDGVDTLIMEVSSHALDLGRVDDVLFNCGIFTNLTQDHLDFHENFENYFEAKSKLFKLIGQSPKKKRFAMINGDDTYGKKLLSQKSQYDFPLLSFGKSEDLDYSSKKGSIVNEITGLKYVLNGTDENVELHFSGMFHIYNSMAALAVAEEFGISSKIALQGLSSLETIPGRFDVLKSDLGFSIVVDYAHTGDALLKLLESVNELDHNRVICVFGCGGDRDKTKRPIMGAIAEKNSDIAIITSDNPRTEDPKLIIEDVKKGFVNKKYLEEVEREDAIRVAISLAFKGDIIVLAGKGHEDYQVIGKEKIHFDDKEIAKKYVDERVIREG